MPPPPPPPTSVVEEDEDEEEDVEMILATSFAKSGSSMPLAVPPSYLRFEEDASRPSLSLSSLSSSSSSSRGGGGAAFQTRVICTPPVIRSTLIATYLSCPVPSRPSLSLSMLSLSFVLLP